MNTDNEKNYMKPLDKHWHTLIERVDFMMLPEKQRG
jgi:hypothetical protein